MRINVSDLKKVVGNLSMAVEKSKLNPKSSWIEIESVENNLYVKVSNYDYLLEANVNIVEKDDGETLHSTVLAEKFCPLVSKLEDGEVSIVERLNSLVVTTEKSEYTFPVIKELGKVKSIDDIPFNPTRCTHCKASGNDIVSISEKNVAGLVDSLFSKDVQRFICFDNEGALTYTEVIYMNNFDTETDDGSEFKILLNGTQAKLLKVFSGYDTVNFDIESIEDYEKNTKVKFYTDNISLVFITQSPSLCEKFPSVKLRKLASSVSEVHAVIDAKAFNRAIARLMIFDKKFDKTVLNYSKLVFGENEVRLVSIKNQNYEVVPYISGTNTTEHESMIRFEDLQNQLKAVTSKDIDISYGDSPAVVINSDGLKQMLPEIRMVERG